MANKTNKDISASQIFALYMQSQRDLKTLSANPFYRKVPEKLAVVKWKRTGAWGMRYDPKTGEQSAKAMMAYMFDQWAKDLFYQEGDEICLSVSKDIYEEYSHTIFIYTPMYQKTKTIFYIYEDDSEPDWKKVGSFDPKQTETKLIFESRQNSNVLVLYEDWDYIIEIQYTPNEKSLRRAPRGNMLSIGSGEPVRQEGKKGPIKIDHLR